MNYLLHGEDLVTSRNYLNELRSQHKGETIIIDGKKIDFSLLKQASESLSLFGDTRLIVIENLFSLQSKTLLKTVCDYLFKNSFSVSIILWEGKEIGKLHLKKIPSSWVLKSFPIPKVMFTFLESLTPGNSQRSFNLLQTLRKSTEENFIFLMLVRQIRLLLLSKDNGLTKMPPWMQGKLKKQANYFSLEQLKKLYQKCLFVDIGQKTGRTALLLNEELDLLLTTF